MRRDDANRILLPAVLITIGILWLLVEVGFVPPRLVATLTLWWPLFLVGAGLDLMLPALRPAKVPFVAFAAAIVLLLGLFAAPVATGADRQLREELPTDARSVTADIDTSSSSTTIAAAADPRSLVEATFTGQPDGRVTTSSGPDATVEIRPVRNGFWFSAGGRWDIGLPSSVPLSLAVDGGSGQLTLDLVALRLRELELEGGSGRVRALLPGNGSSYTAEIDGHSGRVEVNVPPGASVDMDAEFGSGGADVFIGEGSDLMLDLSTGSGSVVLDLPDSAPIRLEVRDDGSGRLQVPPFLTRRSGSGDTGVWESRSLGNGGRVIDVRIRDAGSGTITIR